MSETDNDDAPNLSEADMTLAEYWARTNDSAGAAREAGYTGKYPSNHAYNRLFRNPNNGVYEYAMMIRREMANSRGVNPSSFLDFYIDLFTRPIDEDANAYHRNLAERTKMAAADKLMECLQFFDTKTTKVDNKHSGEIKLEQGLYGKAQEFIRYDVLGLPRPEEKSLESASPEANST